jgi:hypothetical protein
VTRWLCQIAAHAGLTGMESIIRTQIPTRPCSCHHSRTAATAMDTERPLSVGEAARGSSSVTVLSLSMPFPPPLDEQVDRYARSDLGGDLDWHIAQFPFLADDSALQRRVGEEFFTARYLYKLLEGVHRTEQWARSAQARLQVLQYASIYEACLHHVLFQTFKDRPQVSELGRYSTLKEYDVPPALFKSFEHDGRQIVTAYMAQKKAEISKIKFEDKVRAAVEPVRLRLRPPSDVADLRK